MEYIEFILQKFEPLGSVTARRMFGGNVLHMAGRVMGFVFDDNFLFEPGPTVDRLLPDAPRTELFPGSKLFVIIDDSMPSYRLCEIALACYEDFPISKPRRKKSANAAADNESRKEILERFPFAKHIKQ